MTAEAMQQGLEVFVLGSLLLCIYPFLSTRLMISFSDTADL